MSETHETAGNEHIERWLRNCRDIASFCTQNGWIDNDTLTFEILERTTDRILLYVTFDEVIMEGSGCIAGRVPCYGRMELSMDGTRVGRARPV